MDKPASVKEYPAWLRIKRALKEEILSGSVEGMLSESKLIHMHGISITTARRVLNELEQDGLLERKVGRGSIVKDFSRLDNRELGVLFLNIYDRHPSVNRIVEGIEKKAIRKQYHLHLYTTRAKPISLNSHSILYHLVVKRKIGGLIVLSPLPSSDMAFFLRERIPVVAVNNDYQDMEIPTVMSDYKRAVQDACKHLSAMNITRIGLVTKDVRSDGIKRTGDYGLEGYRTFSDNPGTKCPDALHKQKPATEKGGYEAMSEFYEMPEQERPEAIIFLFPPAEIGALHFLRETAGWKPTVVAFTEDENTKFPFYMTPCHQKLGEIAFNLLERQLRNNDRGSVEKILIPIEPVIQRVHGY